MFLQANLILLLALVAATPTSAQQGSGSPIQLDLEQRQAARRTAVERADWSDETFRRRFRLSNLSETDIEPTLREEERELVIEAIALMQDEKVDEAIELVQASVGEETGPVVHFTLGNLSYRKEQFGFAAQHYEKAIELFPRYRLAPSMPLRRSSAAVGATRRCTACSVSATSDSVRRSPRKRPFARR